ncbi:MAG TPA: adenylate/guanylate cyclase domain-containing protein [Actinomycetota bacterium]|nr:adenylate/guanylate cyclase domain-containing protein [Actinomycetota bacterium]
MTAPPLDPELAHWASLLEELRWAGFLLDADFRLVWASPDVRRFLGSPTDEEMGYGLHVLAAFAQDAWRRSATPESRRRLTQDLAAVVLADAAARGVDVEYVPDRLTPLLEGIEPRPFTRPFASSFEYVEPRGEGDLPVMRVNVLVMPLRDGDGDFVGAFALGYMSVRPGLVALLARGDEAMYEGMAKLVEPSSREVAILFCDLGGSTDLARTLPSAQYFRLIRSLWTEIDALVARNRGIVGKHAGDGATAFFLVDDLGSASEAAAAAIRTARGIHERSHDVFGDAPDASCLMRVGLHWGRSLYIGQLVPGGRLDVTALGDAVNECARIQECAEPRQTLASKELLERLSDHDAAAIGLDVVEVRYRTVSELSGASAKARAAAGAIPVTVL